MSKLLQKLAEFSAGIALAVGLTAETTYATAGGQNLAMGFSYSHTNYFGIIAGEEINASVEQAKAEFSQKLGTIGISPYVMGITDIDPLREFSDFPVAVVAACFDFEDLLEKPVSLVTGARFSALSNGDVDASANIGARIYSKDDWLSLKASYVLDAGLEKAIEYYRNELFPPEVLAW